MDISSIFKHPEEKTAVISSAGSITYGDLYRRSENLAKHIVARQAKRVIVYGHKEFSMLIAYLACLRAGAAYVPISPQQPAERRKIIAAKTDADMVLCTVGRGFAGAGSTPTDNIIVLSGNPPKEEVALPEKIDDNELAYMICVSSSDVKEPRMVQATRKNLNNFIRWIDTVIPLTPEIEGNVLNMLMFSVDLSLVDVYYALTHGRTLVTTNTDQQQHLAQLYPHIAKSDAALLVMTPTMAEFLMRSDEFKREMMPKLRVIYLTGESLHPGTVRRLLQRFDENLSVFNGYGATETTCNICAAQITDEMCDDRLPVGCVDTAAVKIRIMKNDAEVPNGEEGEIILVGDSITAGYRSGIPGGYCELDGERAYHTGDIGFKTEDGKYLFWNNRMNGMIKVKGNRMEPGDVENSMTRIKGVTGCGVVERYGNLVAYVTIDREMTPGQIRAAARNHLPSHMIPGIVRIIDSLPMNENGKLDRSKLQD